MTELEKAYKTVLDDILHNAPSMFQGNYDAKNGNKRFMYGVGTVMEYIAFKADNTEKIYEQFSDFFTYNLEVSKQKAKNGVDK